MRRGRASSVQYCMLALCRREAREASEARLSCIFGGGEWGVRTWAWSRCVRRAAPVYLGFL